MPDLAGLTKEQNEALHDLKWALDEYRDAIERRVSAVATENSVRYKLDTIAHQIAGVQ